MKRTAKVFLWTDDGLLCPNGCGLMSLGAVDLQVPVPEARLRCGACGHTNLVAWEEGVEAGVDGRRPVTGQEQRAA